MSSGSPVDGEVAAVGKHAPYPFEGAEAEIVKPQLADGYLEEEDDDSRQFDGNEAESGAKTKSQAVEQDGTNDRLHDVTRQHHRYKDQHPRNHHEHLVFHLDEQRQQQSAYGIEQQDVAASDKHQMAEADAGQYQHAAHEERYTSSGKYQRESYAKQHREDGVELAVDKGKLQESHRLVYFSSGHHRLFIRREEGPQCKLREIGQRDVCQCQSPKNIEYQVTLLFCRRSKFLCHHGCKDKHFFCKPSTKKQQKITFSAHL